MVVKRRSEAQESGDTHLLGGFWLALLAALIASLGGCDHDEDQAKQPPVGVERRIDSLVGDNWVRKGVPPPHDDRYTTPNVALMSSGTLWNVLEASDERAAPRVIVALKPPEKTRGFFKGVSLLQARAVSDERKKVLATIDGVREVRTRKINLANRTALPVFAATVASPKALARLQASPYVDYVEPMIVLHESFSCGGDTYQEGSDVRVKDGHLSGPYTGQDLVPYPYAHHHVQDAWRRLGDSPGAGQGIADLDTGVSDLQQQFFSRYAAVYSRRSHLRLNETSYGINDSCAHGTKVASVAAAPRDGRSVVGIAWRAPLMTIKINDTPLADGSVASICNGIADAVAPPDGRPPARVIGMAFGLTYFSPTVAECIRTAFESSPRTLFVAAAGSGVTEVVFPANLDDFVSAVSMVEIVPGGYRLMGRPLTVAYGPSVDFVSAIAPTKVPAAGKRSDGSVDEIVTFGQSSAATAIYTGLFALASQYAETQGWNRSQLLAALRLSASRRGITDFSGEPVQAIIGAGIVDAYRATGGARKAVINGPYRVRPKAMVTLQAGVDAVVPPGAAPLNHFRYIWIVNGRRVATGSRAVLRAPASGTLSVRLVARDTVDDHTLYAAHAIEVVEAVPLPVRRTLFWTSHVADWATFFNGGRHTRVVNIDVLAPQGCRVIGVLGLLMANVGGVIKPAPGETPKVSIDRGNVGFTVVRPEGLAANSLEAVVHQWHDGFSAVRTKVVYDILQPAGVDCAVPGVLATTP